METKHTPGPWLVHDSYDEDQKIIVWNGDEQAHKPICDMGEMGDMNYADELANAKLISAAPDLLEVLQKWVRLFNIQYEKDAESGKEPQTPTIVMDAIAAIKKATL